MKMGRPGKTYLLLNALLKLSAGHDAVVLFTITLRPSSTVCSPKELGPWLTQETRLFSHVARS
jgi:hypothetical protein